MKFSSTSLVLSAAIVSFVGITSAHAAVNVEAAEAMLKKDGCTKCHSVDKKKAGPSFKSVAEKLKGKPDAQAKLITHVTTGPMIEVDGEKEAHAKVKTTDKAEITNLVDYILSR